MFLGERVEKEGRKKLLTGEVGYSIIGRVQGSEAPSQGLMKGEDLKKKEPKW